MAEGDEAVRNMTSRELFHPSKRGLVLGVHALCVLGIVSASISSAFAEDTGSPRLRFGFPSQSLAPDVALVESLINDGFASMAKDLCESRLATATPDTDAQAQWLMLAMQADVAIRLKDFDFSGDPKGLSTLLADWEPRLASNSKHPRALWLRWKHAWCRWMIQQRALAAYLAVPSREALREWIIASIREALDTSEQLQLEVRKLATGPGTKITPSQRLDLQGNLDLLVSDLLYQRSQCYGPGSDDRIAAASEMLRSLDQALGKLPADWSHRPGLSVARIRALVQVEKYEEASSAADALWDKLAENANAISQQYLRSLSAIGARAARMRQGWDQFDRWIERGGGAMANPELALEQFAADIARADGDFAAKSLQWKREIATRFGPYWEQRADALLVSAARSTDHQPSNASLEVLRIEVRQLLAAQRWEDALKKLEQAELAAVSSASESEAFGFAMQRAAALESQGKRGLAADTFYHAATSFPSQAKSAAAALMSAWMIRPEAREDGIQTENRLQTYRERLQETALRWPTSDPASQAIDWLERDALAHDSFEPLLKVWLAPPTTTQQRARGTARYAFVTTLIQEDWLEPSPFASSPILPVLPDWQAHLEREYRELDRERYSQTLSLLPRERRWDLKPLPSDAATLSGTIAWLLTGPPSKFQDEDSLQALLEPWQNDPLGRIGMLWTALEWRSSSALSKPEPPSSDQLRCIVLLTRALREATQKPQPYPMGPVIAARIDRSILFHTMAFPESPAAGSERYALLEKERDSQKKSAWWLYRAARVLQADPVRRKDAIPWYRQMASGFAAGTEPWLEARARTTQTLRWLGDGAAADQLRDLVLATYPNATIPWKSRLESK